MADTNLNPKSGLAPAHLPTIALIIGYVLYWVELYIVRMPSGHTSLLAWGLWAGFAVFFLVSGRRDIRCGVRGIVSQWRSDDYFRRALFFAAAVLLFVLLIIAIWAQALPAHLPQEYDFLNYHLTIARQHLIRHSFAHIPWSSADLFTLPVDFALAPYWLATTLPNKLPQIMFFIGLLLSAGRLSGRLNPGLGFPGWFILVIALGATHGLGIQLGTAMLDIALAYLFIAGIDSFLSGSALLAAVEFAFFFWSKPFIPLQMAAIIVCLLVIYLAGRRRIFKQISWGFLTPPDASVAGSGRYPLRRFFIIFFLCSLSIGGPFIIKSLIRSGTPLFPFGQGSFSFNAPSEVKQAIKESASAYNGVRDNYGSGRSVLSLAKHFWLVAVPERGVNNSYDYPLGLPYLLFLGPFVWFIFQALRQRIFPMLPLFVVLYWASWWFGSQQSRFLYLPVVLIMALTVGGVRLNSRPLLSALVLALALNVVSVYRAHGRDLQLPVAYLLRPADQALLELNDRYRISGRADTVALDYYDVAYAEFPVDVVIDASPWVIYPHNY